MIPAPKEFQVGENAYRANRMPAMVQWNVVRRLTPFAASLTGLAATVSAEPAEGEKDVKTLQEAILQAVRRPGATDALELAAKALADMKDEDSAFIIKACLAGCERRAGTGWSAVWNATADRAQYAELEYDLGQQLRICMEVLKHNLGGFFPELLSALSAEAPK